MHKILIIDDKLVKLNGKIQEEELRIKIEEALNSEYYLEFWSPSPKDKGEDIKKSIQSKLKNNLKLVLLDRYFPGCAKDGWGILDDIKDISPDIPVVMLTVERDFESILKTFKRGAQDYIIKHEDTGTNEIYFKVKVNTESENFKIIGFVGTPGRKLFRQIFQASKTTVPVFIHGDSGVGKELIANAIHSFSIKSKKQLRILTWDTIAKLQKDNLPYQTISKLKNSKELMKSGFKNKDDFEQFLKNKNILSQIEINKYVPEIWGKLQRKKPTFVPAVLGAIPETLLESELFGYRKGAFTGAFSDKDGLFIAAHLGTLFLDEIGDVSKNIQFKLLRAIQEKEVWKIGDVRPTRVNCRIISATNKNIKKRISKNKFREDLFYRLHIFTIFVPPLRERKGDIQVLMAYFINQHQQEFNLPYNGFSNNALQQLIEYDWPGNVRQLENAMLVLLSKYGNEEIDSQTVKEFLREYAIERKPQEIDIDSLVDFFSRNEDSITDNLNYIKVRIVQETVEKCGGNRTKAAKMLGVSKASITTILKKGA